MWSRVNGGGVSVLNELTRQMFQNSRIFQQPQTDQGPNTGTHSIRAQCLVPKLTAKYRPKRLNT